MVKPVTAKFEDLVIEVEFTPSSGTYTKVCGMRSGGVDRKSNMATTPVPADCDDESLPDVLERAVENQEVTISGAGSWARQSHEAMLDWWYSGQPLNVRVQHVQASVGDTEYETGPAYLASLSNQREKGQKVTAEIAIEFDGLPTRTAKAA